MFSGSAQASPCNSTICRGTGKGYGVGQQMEEIASRTLQLDGQGDLVQSPHAHAVWVGNLPLVKSPGSFDVIQQPGNRKGRMVSQYSFPGILKVRRL